MEGERGGVDGSGSGGAERREGCEGGCAERRVEEGGGAEEIGSESEGEGSCHWSLNWKREVEFRVLNF